MPRRKAQAATVSGRRAALLVLLVVTPRSALTEPFPYGPPPERPVPVEAAFALRDVNAIDDENESFEFDGILALSWKDPRQAFDPAVEGVEERVFQGDFQFAEVFEGWYPQVVLVNQSGLYERRGVLLRIRPDGTVLLVQELNAAAKTDIDLLRYPFDRQRLEAVFEVLGFGANEVAFRSVEAPGVAAEALSKVRMPQWTLRGIGTRVEELPLGWRQEGRSTFVLRLDVERKSLFAVRLVIIPLVLMVMLSWSVFWMDQSSVGDRINVSFIGILTVVAYQIVLSDILPQSSYFTLINAFLNVSLLLMCATVVVNLVVGHLDRRGRNEVGDRIDRRCRWVFPAVYLALNGVAVLTAWLRPGPA